MTDGSYGEYRVTVATGQASNVERLLRLERVAHGVTHGYVMTEFWVRWCFGEERLRALLRQAVGSAARLEICDVTKKFIDDVTTEVE